MADYTGQRAAWNGLRNALGAWIEWVNERKIVFESLTPEKQKEWISSQNDPIIEEAYWLWLNLLNPMFEDTPDKSITPPIEVEVKGRKINAKAASATPIGNHGTVNGGGGNSKGGGKS